MPLFFEICAKIYEGFQLLELGFLKNLLVRAWQKYVFSGVDSNGQIFLELAPKLGRFLSTYLPLILVQILISVQTSAGVWLPQRACLVTYLLSLNLSEFTDEKVNRIWDSDGRESMGVAGLSKNQATRRYDNETVNFTKQPSTNIE